MKRLDRWALVSACCALAGALCFVGCQWLAVVKKGEPSPKSGVVIGLEQDQAEPDPEPPPVPEPEPEEITIKQWETHPSTPQ